MKHCIPRPDLPKIPEFLIETLEEIEENHENSYYNKEVAHMYVSHWTDDDLTMFLQPYFDFEIATKYQIIKSPLVLHTDHNIYTGWKFIYIVSTGGDNAITRWWDDVDNPTEMLDECHMKPNCWYHIDVDTPHEVINVEYPRINIVVRHNK